MTDVSREFIQDAAGPLGWFYLACCAMNVAAAWRAWDQRRAALRACAWLALATGFAALAWRAFAGEPLAMPEALRRGIDAGLRPATLFAGACLAGLVFYEGRRLFVRPAVAWIGLNASWLLLGASLGDPGFAEAVMKPDHVPIVAMLYLLGFCLWWAAAQAVENDRRAAAGAPPVEKQYAAKALVWPDLVYIELICAVVAMAVLMAWSLGLRAPLEQPADPAVTPNPSKAPWYFVGLQELLVYADAWLVGVAVPCLAVLGLAAIPYLDRNPRGSGYYTIRERRFALLVFLAGFLVLWILPICVGTFLRGPDWSFCGLYGPRDPPQSTAPGNVRLSDCFWTLLCGRAVPQAPPGASGAARLAWIAWREIAGLVLVAGYFLGMPPLLARTAFRDLCQRMGRWRYTLMVLLLLAMLVLPMKMALCWTLNLSHVVAMPEYRLNL